MRVGFAAADPTNPSSEAAEYLKVRHFGIQAAYLRYLGYSWTDGMLASSWLTEASAADKVNLAVPMLVGPQSGSPVDGASGSGQTTSPQNPSNVTTPTTMTLTDVAAGVWDNLFGQVFSMIAGIRPDCIIRLGHEQYGNGWYPWNGAGLYTQYGNAYRHLVTLARTYSASFQFDWNGNIAYASYDPTVAYPGDAYVDFMTADVYDGYAPGGAAGWAAYRDAVLTAAVSFAVSRGKPFGFTEFGTFAIGYSSGYGDDPEWLKAAYYWIRQNHANMAFACFFNHYGGDPATDGSGALQRNPQMGAVFKALFGTWAQQLGGQTTHRFISSGSNRLRRNR